MKSSSKFFVSVHILSVLAIRYNEKDKTPISSDAIAKSVNTNAVVIRRIIGMLGKYGLVKTKHGRQGGALLGKPPKSITLFDIYDAVIEGSIFHSHYRAPSVECLIGAHIIEVLPHLLAPAEQAISAELGKITLRDVVDCLCRREGGRMENLTATALIR